MTHTPLGAGGEFNLIRAMAAQWGAAARGLGDDAAILALPAGHQLVVSTDASVEGVHFRREWFTPQEIGWRAVASALSDLAAMGATPLGVLIALSLPAAWRNDLAALADGMGDCAHQCQATILGGDTTAGPVLSLSVTVLGYTERPLLRSGAAVGDGIFVSGALGGPRRAWQTLERGHRPTEADMRRFSHPEPRLPLGQWLTANGATALLDISDGLAQDLGHLAAASGVRLQVALAQVPCVEGMDAEESVQSGEEYELAFTAPEGFDASSAAAAGQVPVQRIGTVVAGPPGVELWREGRVVELLSGFDHFSLL